MRSTSAFRRPSRGARSRGAVSSRTAGWSRRAPRRGKSTCTPCSTRTRGRAISGSSASDELRYLQGDEEHTLRREARWNGASGDRAFLREDKGQERLERALGPHLRPARGRRAAGRRRDRAERRSVPGLRLRGGEAGCREETGRDDAPGGEHQDEVALESVATRWMRSTWSTSIRSEPDEDTFRRPPTSSPTTSLADVDNVVQRLAEEYSFEAEVSTRRRRAPGIRRSLYRRGRYASLGTSRRGGLRQGPGALRDERIAYRREGEGAGAGESAAAHRRTSSTARRRTSPASSAVTPRSPLARWAFGLRRMPAVADRRISFNPYPRGTGCAALAQGDGGGMYVVSNWDLGLAGVLEDLDWMRCFDGLVVSAVSGVEKPDENLRRGARGQRRRQAQGGPRRQRSART